MHQFATGNASQRSTAQSQLLGLSAASPSARSAIQAALFKADPSLKTSNNPTPPTKQGLSQSQAQAIGGNVLSGGSAPPGVTVGPGLGTPSGIVSSVAQDVVDALSSVFDSAVSEAKYAALAFVAIIGGFMLISRGVVRATHAEKAS